MEIRHKKIDPSRPGFQGNSRSLELTDRSAT